MLPGHANENHRHPGIIVIPQSALPEPSNKEPQNQKHQAPTRRESGSAARTAHAPQPHGNDDIKLTMLPGHTNEKHRHPGIIVNPISAKTTSRNPTRAHLHRCKLDHMITPQHWEADVVLNDGDIVTLRPVPPRTAMSSRTSIPASLIGRSTCGFSQHTPSSPRKT